MILSYAIWIYSNMDSTTQSFWRITGEQSDVRINAVVEETNKVIGSDLDLHYREWEDARQHTAKEIDDNRMHDLYPGSAEAVTDETMFAYWNYANDFQDANERTLTLDGFVNELRQIRPPPSLRLVKGGDA